MAKIDAITIPVRFEVEGLEDLVRRLIREELDARQGEEDAEALQAVERELGKPRRVSGTRGGPGISIHASGCLTWSDAAHEIMGRPARVRVTFGTKTLQIFPSDLLGDSVPVRNVNLPELPNWMALLPYPLELRKVTRRPARSIQNMRGEYGVQIGIEDLWEVQV